MPVVRLLKIRSMVESVHATPYSATGIYETAPAWVIPGVAYVPPHVVRFYGESFLRSIHGSPPVPKT